MKNDEFKKRPLPLKSSSPGSKKADFSEKFLFGIWTLILSRCDIKWLIYGIILHIYYIYIKGPIQNRY